MRAIAARLNVSSTVLYQHFDSKGAIVRELRLEGARRLRESLAAAEASTPTEHFASLAESYVAYALGNPWLYRMLFTGDDVDWSDLAFDEREELLGPLRIVHRFLEDGKRDEVFAKDLDVDHTTVMIWASMHGLATMLLDGRISASHPMFPVRDVSAFVRSYIEGVVRGLELPRSGE